ncbi:hypothetical protein J2T55_000540 [Methylohalomonas lacus]|uniref:Uncharacterized protein n=1 Tax=Methylohalomonas lacus TaxID=398773 RepID=A0AAE3HK10_9GAMM|nr:hypothetical protein [Methylohalomonas lacus]MCS3902536.1 hypothetical protein [Methylohalomonas lacus]
MTLGIAGLVTAYVLIALLLLSINLYSNWSWRVKAGAIIITTAFYIISYISFPPLLGWPTMQKLPERFKLIAVHVEQPDKTSGDEGNIYLWVTRIDDLTSYGAPRAYKLPYSDMLHEAVIKANAKLKKDIPQLGELTEGSMEADMQDTSKAGVSTKNPIEFYDLPDPLFPEK